MSPHLHRFNFGIPRVNIQAINFAVPFSYIFVIQKSCISLASLQTIKKSTIFITKATILFTFCTICLSTTTLGVFVEWHTATLTKLTITFLQYFMTYKPNNSPQFLLVIIPISSSVRSPNSAIFSAIKVV